jgi:hypothetical protein
MAAQLAEAQAEVQRLQHEGSERDAQHGQSLQAASAAAESAKADLAAARAAAEQAAKDRAQVGHACSYCLSSNQKTCVSLGTSLRHHAQELQRWAAAADAAQGELRARIGELEGERERAKRAALAELTTCRDAGLRAVEELEAQVRLIKDASIMPDQALQPAPCSAPAECHMHAAPSLA